MPIQEQMPRPTEGLVMTKVHTNRENVLKPHFYCYSGGAAPPQYASVLGTAAESAPFQNRARLIQRICGTRY